LHKTNPDEDDFENSIALTDEQAKHKLLKFKDQFRKGKIIEKDYTALLKLYLSLKLKLTKQLKEGLRRSTESSFYTVLNFLFIYFKYVEKEDHD